MAQQNINQFVYNKYKLNLVSDSMDMSLTSDERNYNHEVIFSPYIIAQTYGNKLPLYFDINDPMTVQDLTLTYKNFNSNNVFVSQNYYNPDSLDVDYISASTTCDIGLTGIDNGLVSGMTGQTLYFTNGIFDDTEKFDRLHMDRRMKLFQVTGYTGNNEKFSGSPKYTLYEVVSKTDPSVGKYHELYGGFYQGFYKLFGYDYEILPERMNKGWSVEMVLKPRFVDEYSPGPNETTLNKLYPKNKNTFFYFGTRAENKFYHYADGHPNCFTGYTRITTPLSGCLQTCACCDRTITNSRCIFVYPPRPQGGQYDTHVSYGCNVCGGIDTKKESCGCSCGDYTCESCGWQCFSHPCDTIITPTPTPTPEPTPTPVCDTPTPTCTPTCTTCSGCTECLDCAPSGFTSVENTCEVDPLYDLMSNNISFKLCGDPKNPSIGVKVLRFTGDCITTGTTTTGTGSTFVTGYTIQEWCSDPIYDYCKVKNPDFLQQEHWFLVDVVWERYSYLETCDLWYRGGLGDITEKYYLESLANNTVALIRPPYTNNKSVPEQVELVNLNDKWLLDKKFRNGRLKIYVNGMKIYTIENFEEVIPRALNTDKEKQLGVPFNISWGGGTQGLHENLTFSSCSALTSNYIQDPECFPTSTLSGTSLSGLNTNILLEQEFGGTFDGAISQFRMYVEPLSSAEIRHNFNIVKDKFNMFNPLCPDCQTLFCATNDLTYTISEITTTTTTSLLLPFGLGRIHHEDLRDHNYLIKDHFDKLVSKKPKPTPTRTPTKTPTRTPSVTVSVSPTNTPTPTPTPGTSTTSMYWDDNVWWGNQGDSPQCVGYSWAHWTDDGPVYHSGNVHPYIQPSVIYSNAQRLDPWSSTPHDGTTVRAAATYLKTSGIISNYYWAFDVQTLINTLLTLGPVVVGTNWYYNMFYPNSSGQITVGGRLAGGHAYVLNGIDTQKQLFRIKNSWGQSWGVNGHAYISFNDMARLIGEQGEVCLAVEIPN